MTEVGKYAEAIFLIAEEDGSLEAIYDDLKTVDAVLSSNPEYINILDTPALPKEERLGLIKEAFSSLSENARNLIGILTEKRIMHTFTKLFRDFTRLYNEKAGILEAEVVSAVALSDNQISSLAEKLSKKLSKKVVIKNTVDKTILGGMLLRYDSVQLDASVKSRLDSFASGLKKVTI